MGIAIPKEIEELGALYDIEIGAAAWLENRLHLVPVLEEMAPVLKAFFPDGPLRLQLERDPETGRALQIWVYALWCGNPEEWMQARECLDEFDATWWRDNSARIRGQIAVDFRVLERAK